MKKFKFKVTGDEEGTIFTAECLGEFNGYLYRISWGETDSLGEEKFSIYRPELVKTHLEKLNWIKVG